MDENIMDRRTIRDYVPSTFHMTPNECQEKLRRLEFETYEKVISVFRAQGPLSESKRILLHDIRKVLRIPIERHKAEIRRVNNNEEILSLSEAVTGTIYDEDWLVEGFRVSPILHRNIPLTSITRIANIYKLNNDCKKKNYFQFDYEQSIDKQRLPKEFKKKKLSSKPLDQEKKVQPMCNPIRKEVPLIEERTIEVSKEVPEARKEVTEKPKKLLDQEPNYAKAPPAQPAQPVRTAPSIVTKPPLRPNPPLIANPPMRTPISSASPSPYIQPKPVQPKIQPSANIIKINTSKMTPQPMATTLNNQRNSQQISGTTTKIVSILPGNFSAAKQIKIVGVNNNSNVHNGVVSTTITTTPVQNPQMVNRTVHQNLVVSSPISGHGNQVMNRLPTNSTLQVNRVFTTTNNQISSVNRTLVSNVVRTSTVASNPASLLMRPQVFTPSHYLQQHVVQPQQPQSVPITTVFSPQSIISSHFQAQPQHQHLVYQSQPTYEEKDTHQTSVGSEGEIDVIGQALMAAEMELEDRINQVHKEAEADVAAAAAAATSAATNVVQVSQASDQPSVLFYDDNNKTEVQVLEQNLQETVESTVEIEDVPVSKETLPAESLVKETQDLPNDQPSSNKASVTSVPPTKPVVQKEEELLKNDNHENTEVMHIEISKNHGGGYLQIPIPYSDCDLDAINEDTDLSTQIITYRYFKDNGQSASNITSMIPQFGGRFPSLNAQTPARRPPPQTMEPQLNRTPNAAQTISGIANSYIAQQQQQIQSSSRKKEENLSNSDQENQNVSVIDLAPSGIELKQIYDETGSNNSNYLSDSEPDTKRRRCYAPLF